MLEVDVSLQRGSFLLEAAFTAPTPGVTALFGRSGCGKTTLVNLIAGLLRDGSGRIALDGECWFDSARGQRLWRSVRQAHGARVELLGFVHVAGPCPKIRQTQPSRCMARVHAQRFAVLRDRQCPVATLLVPARALDELSGAARGPRDLRHGSARA